MTQNNPYMRDRKELMRLYNLLIEGIEGREDFILTLNDLLTLYLILVHKLFEQGTDKENSLLIDSVKGMTNQWLQDLMGRINKEEIITKDETPRD